MSERARAADSLLTLLKVAAVAGCIYVAWRIYKGASGILDAVEDALDVVGDAAGAVVTGVKTATAVPIATADIITGDGCPRITPGTVPPYSSSLRFASILGVPLVTASLTIGFDGNTELAVKTMIDQGGWSADQRTWLVNSIVTMRGKLERMLRECAGYSPQRAHNELSSLLYRLRAFGDHA